MALDPDGRLVVCEQGTRSQHAARSAASTAQAARAETLVDSWRGLPLNSPNDVVVKSDGTIWFTDPSYGHLQGFRPEPQLGDYVYRYDPARGRLAVVADSFDKPNGLAFSPDETHPVRHRQRREPGARQLLPGRPTTSRRSTCRRPAPRGRATASRSTTPGFPDGIKVDAEGRVYASSFGGVQVFSPDGDLLGEIDLPGAVNFTFGGPTATSCSSRRTTRSGPCCTTRTAKGA